MDDLDQSVDWLNPISLSKFLVDADGYSSSLLKISVPAANSPQQTQIIPDQPYIAGLSPIPYSYTPQCIKYMANRTSTPLHPHTPTTHLQAMADFITTPETAEDNYQQPLSASVLCQMGDFFHKAMDINTTLSPSPKKPAKTQPNGTARVPLKERQQGKPSETYVALIGKALLSSTTGCMTLSQIYDHIMTAYPFYRSTSLAWRNAVRHNLAINDCFVKAGRTEIGRGFYWAIHASYVQTFNNGNFIVVRRKTQKKSHNSIQPSLPQSFTAIQSRMNGNNATVSSHLREPSSNLRSLRL